jgi:hypothetical protein
MASKNPLIKFVVFEKVKNMISTYQEKDIKNID